MELREYLFRKRITTTRMAEIIGCNRQYLSLIVLKKTIPSPKMAEKISLATQREVSVEELLNIDEEQKKINE